MSFTFFIHQIGEQSSGGEVTPPANYEEEVLADNPLGYWRLGESSGTTASDETGNYDGSYENTPTLGEDGVPGLTPIDTSVLFDSGSSEHVDMTNTTSLEFLHNEAFSLEAWIKTTSALDQRIVGRQLQSGNRTGYILGQVASDSGKLYFQLRESSNYIDVRVDSTAFQDGAWHHVVVTYDGGGAASGVTFYVDGSVAATTTNTDTLTTVPTAAIIFCIGARNGAAPHFDGHIDEVAVYASELTAQQVTDHFNYYIADNYRALVFDDTPTSYWRLGEVSGFSAADEMPAANDGIINNSPTLGEPGAIKNDGNTAITFNGSTQQVNCQNIFDFERTDDFTLECWIKTTATGTKWILGNEESSGNNRGYGIYLTGSNYFGFQLVNSGPSNMITVEAQTVINDGEWHHLVATYDGSSTAAGCTLYLDGVDHPLTVVQNGLAATIVGSATFAIASRNNADLHIAATIDEVAVYEKVLTSTEVQEHYLKGFSGEIYTGYPAVVLLDAPNGYWKLNEPTGTVAADVLGNNDGTYASSPIQGVTGLLTGDADLAVEFDAVSTDYVFVTDAGDLIGSEGTIELWFKPDWSSNDNTNHILWDCYFTSNQFFRCQHFSDNQWYIGWQNATDYRVTFSQSFMPVVAGGTYHLVFTWNDTTNESKVYMNGVLVQTKTDALVTLALTSADLYIGRDFGASTPGYYDGVVDEVALYPTVLTGLQIAEHYEAGAVTTGYFFEVIGDNPVGYWRLGESSGTTAIDVVGSNDGTYAGGFVLGQVGAIATDDDTAVDFNGSTGGVTDATPSGIALTGDVTIECWIKPDALPSLNDEWALLKYGGPSETEADNILYSLAIRNNGGTHILRAAHEYSSGSNQIQDVNHTTSTTAWSHIVMVRDATALTLTFYVNGAQVGTPQSYAFQATGGGNAELTIGTYASAQYFDGLIDEVALYDRALSSVEVLAHYNASQPVTYSQFVIADGPLSYYRLGESSGSTAFDEMGAVNGTINGSVNLGVTGALAGDADTAYEFDTLNEEVVALVTRPTEITVEAWCKINTATGNLMSVVMNDNGGSNRHFQMMINDVTNFPIFTFFTAGGIGGGHSHIDVDDGQWHYIAITYDSALGLASIYVDGKLEFQSTASLSGNLLQPSSALWIGSDDYGTPFRFDGSIDEVAVYDYPLTSAQIWKHWEIGTNAVVNDYETLILTHSPTAYYRLNESSGTTIVDEIDSPTGDGTYNLITLQQQGAINGDDDKGVFSSTTAQMQVPSLDYTLPFTIEGWFMTDGSEVSAFDTLISNNNNNGFTVNVDNSNPHLHLIRASTFIITAANDTWTHDTWHHVAVVYDGSEWHLYQDGKSLGSSATAGITTVGDTYFTRRPDGGINYQGWADELALYDMAVPRVWLSGHYRTGLGDTAWGYGFDPTQIGDGASTMENGFRALTQNISTWRSLLVFPQYNLSQDKWYCEVTWVDHGGQPSYFGVSEPDLSAVITQTIGLGNSVGARENGAVYQGGSNTGSVASYTTGDIIMIACDKSTGDVWFGKNGVWTGDPEAGTGAAGTLTGGLYVPGVSLFNEGMSARINTGQSAFSYTIPENFYSYDETQNNVPAPPIVDSYETLINADTPDHYWRMGESSGTSLIDSVGSSNLTTAASPTLSQPSLIAVGTNKSIAFDKGSSQYAEATASYDGASALSIEAWIYSTAYNQTGTGEYIFSLAETTVNNGFDFEIKNGLLYCNVVTGAGSTIEQISYRVVDGEIYHVVVTYDGVNARMYVNAVEADNSPVAVTLGGGIEHGTGDITIGNFNGSASGFGYTGLVDEAALYSRALTPTEIEAHYDTGKAITEGNQLVTLILADDPVVYYRLDEASGSTAASQVNSPANDGTYQNTPLFGQGSLVPAIPDNTSIFLEDADYIELPGVMDVLEKTIEFWFEYGTNDIYDRVLTTNTAYSNECLIAVGDINESTSLIFVNNSGSEVTARGRAMVQGGRHHYIGVFDGARWYVYQDGVRIKNPASIEVGWTFQGGVGWSIGRRHDGSQEMNGGLDEFVMYDKLLSHETAYDHYEAGAGQTSAYRKQIFLDHPVSYWRLNELHGSIAFDEMGIANGTYSTGITLGQTGALDGDSDYAADFDGVSGEVIMANTATLRITGSLTMEAWVYMDALPASGQTDTIISCSGDSTSESATENFLYFMGLWNNAGTHRLYYLHEYSGGSNEEHFIDYELPTSEWVHYVITRNDASKVINFYVNGVLVGIATYGNTAFSGTSGVVSIGNSNNASNFYTGKVDEVAIYDYELPQAQVVDHYLAGVPAVTEYERTVRYYGGYSYWPIQDGSGTTLVDRLHGSDATASAGVELTPEGPFIAQSGHSGIRLDSDPEYFETPADASAKGINLKNPFTLSMWVKTEGNTLAFQIIANEGATNNWALFFDYVQDRIGFNLNSVNAIVPTAQTWIDQQWNHVVLSWDGTNYRLYQNAAQLGLYGSASGSPAGTQANVRWGKWLSAGDGQWHGTMAEISYHRRALTFGEIRSLYQLGTSGIKQFQQKALSYNPITYWPLSDTNSTAIELVQNPGQSGAYVNNPLRGEDSRVPTSNDYSTFFDETQSERVTLTDWTGYDMAGSQITIACWVEFDDLTTGADQFYPIIAKRSTGANIDFQLSYLLDTNQTANLNKLAFSSGGASIWSAISAGTITDTDPHFVAVTYDGLRVKFYIDGEPAGEVDNSGGLTDLNSGIGIGWIQIGAGAHYDGHLDDVVLYDRALTYQQIKQMYTAGNTLDTTSWAKVVMQTVPEVFIRPGIAEGFGLQDLSGNRRHGAYQGVKIGTQGPNKDGTKAVTITGTGTKIRVPGGWWTGTEDFAVNIWVRHESTGGGVEILDREWNGGTTQRFTLGTNYTRIGDFQMDVGGAVITNGANANDDKWHMLTAIRQTSAIRLYVDGVQMPTTGTGGVGDANNNEDYFLGIHGNAVNFFPGDIGDYSFYVDNIPSDAEIWSMYQEAAIFGYKENIQSYEPACYFRLGSIAGTAEPDWSGNGNHATINNLPTRGQPGAIPGESDGAMDFTGIGTNITWPGTMWDGTGDFTVNVWLKRTSTALNNLFDRVHTGSFDNRLVVGCNFAAAGSIDFGWDDGPSDGTLSALGTNINDGAWHMVTWRRSGSTGEIFLDGVLQTNTTGTGPTSGDLANGNNFILGEHGNGDNDYTGDVDEFMFFTRALTNTEITEIYNLNQSMTYEESVLYAKPIGYWRMDETEGNLVSQVNPEIMNATVTNCNYGTTSDITGGGTGCEFLSGDNDYAQVPDHPMLTPKRSMSLEAWIKTSTIAGGFVCKDDVALNRQYLLDISGGDPGKFYFGIFLNSTSRVVLSDVRKDDGEWHHVVGRWDRDAGEVSIFIDGTKQVDTETGLSSDILDDGTAPLTFGDYSSLTQGADVELDEVALYDYALSDSVIAEHAAYRDNPYETLVLGDSPVGYWRLEEASGTLAEDELGNNNGTYVNAPTYGATGIDGTIGGKAITFNGTDEYITMGDVLDFDRENPFTLECWFKTTTVTASALVGKQNSSVNFVGYAMGIEASAALWFLLAESGGTQIYVNTTTTTWNDDNWHHAVVTYDGGSEAKGVEIYVDGQRQEKTVIQNDLASGVTTSAFPLNVAARNNGSNPFNGTVDEVAIYDAALTPAEIYDHYLLGAAQVASDYTKLIISDSPEGYWKLGETSGTTAEDERGLDDGTYTGTYSLNQTGIAGETDPAVDLDGSSGEIPTTAVSHLQITGALTMEAWVNIAALPGTDVTWDLIVCAGNPDSESSSENYMYSLKVLNASGLHYLRYFHEYSGGSNQESSIQYSIPTGEWVHLAATRDTTTKIIRFYVNGIFVGSNTYTTDTTAAVSAKVTIGNANGASVGTFFDGLVDEVAIYNRILSGEELFEHYNLGSASALTTVNDHILHDSPIAYWRLGESSGTTANDEIGSQDGTLVPGAGTLTLGAPSLTAGDADTALTMAGVHDGVQLLTPNYDNLAIKTVECWVQPDNFEDTMVYFKEGGSSNGFGLGQVNGSFRAAVTSVGANQNTEYPIPHELIGTPIHVAAVFDNPNDRIKLYINGIKVAQRNAAVGAHNGGNACRIGSNVDTATQSPLTGTGNRETFLGVIDEVAIYDYEVPDYRIKAHHDAGKAVSYQREYEEIVRFDNPVTYWPLGDAPGVSNADDILGSFDPSINGTILLGVPGIPGSKATAFDFNAQSGAYLWLASRPIDFLGDYSLEIWVKLKSIPLGNNVAFLGESNTIGTSITLTFNTSGQLQFSIWDGGAAHNAVYPGAVPLGEWLHLVGTKSVDNGMVFYLNGQVAARDPYTGNSDNRTSFVLGRHEFDDVTVDAVMAHGAVYRYELQPEQVLNHYNVGSTPLNLDYQTLVLSGDPIAYYRLGETSGTTAVDVMGTHDGTVVNSPTQGATGLIDGDSDTAYELDRASSQYVSLPTALVPTGAAAKSIEAWIEKDGDATSPEDVIVHLGNINNQGEAFVLTAIDSEQLGFNSWGPAAGHDRIFDYAYINKRVHVALVYDGTDKYAYVNGTLQAQDAVTLNTVATYAQIGALGGPTNYGDGVCDEVAIYDRALEASEVAERYIQGHSPYLRYMLANFDHMWRLNDASVVGSAAGSAKSLFGGVNGQYVVNTTLNYQQASVLPGDPDTTSVATSDPANNDGLVKIPHTAIDFEGHDEWTLGVWVHDDNNLASGSSTDTIWSDGDAVNEFRITVNEASASPGLAIRFIVGGVDRIVGAGSSFAANTTHLVILTYDGTTFSLYQDNTLVGTYVGAVPDFGSQTDTLFGDRYTDQAFPWAGRMGDIFYRSKHITLAEVQQIWTLGN